MADMAYAIWAEFYFEVGIGQRSSSANTESRGTAQPARLFEELTVVPTDDVNLLCSLHFWGVSIWLGSISGFDFAPV